MHLAPTGTYWYLVVPSGALSTKVGTKFHRQVAVAQSRSDSVHIYPTALPSWHSRRVCLGRTIPVTYEHSRSECRKLRSVGAGCCLRDPD
jgi:hypothetical protein